MLCILLSALLLFSFSNAVYTYADYDTLEVNDSDIQAASPRLRNGYYWANTPRYVYFRCDFPTYQRQAVQSAMQQWNSVGSPYGGLVTMYLTTQVTDNSVEFSSFFGSGVGYTIHTADGNNQIYSVRVMLNNAYNWSVGASAGCYDIQSVVLHELGHALGVAHCHENGETSCFSSTCSSNVMQPVIGTNMTRTTFQPYDTASYLIIYT